MKDLLLEAEEHYEAVFGDVFPTFPFFDASEEEIIEMINSCIAEKKDVRSMGYLPSDPDIRY